MVRLVVAACALFAGCVQSSEVRCADGRLCPPGYSCDDENGRCLSADQITACSGLAEGAECSIAGAPGACRSGTCEPLVCGDGVRSLGEACDGTDLGAATCLDAGFYDAAGLACTEFCTFDVSGCSGTCGDNILNGLELCDGAPPPGACIEHGFDAGDIGCAAQSCGISFTGCVRFGWRPEPTTLVNAYGFDGTSPNDLWIAGVTDVAAAVAHFDGVSWTVEALNGDIGELPLDLSIVGPGDIWIVRDDGFDRWLERRVGGQWARLSGVPVAEYVEIWGADSNAVFVATTNAGVLSWNGATWQTLGTLTAPLATIDGTSSTDIWVASTDGALHHWNGSTWQPHASPFKVEALHASRPNEIAVAGESATSAGQFGIGYWDGTQWTTAWIDDTFTRLASIIARGANDMWAADVYGEVWHYDGHVLTPSSVVSVNPGAPLLDLRHFGQTTIAYSFDGFVYRFNGLAYAKYQIPTSFGLIGSTSPTPLEMVTFDGRNSSFHFNNVISAWTPKTIDTAPSPQRPAAFLGFAPDDIWVVGTQGGVFRYDGSAWQEQTAPISNSPLHALAGTSPSDVYIFGTVNVHYDGMTFELLSIAPENPEIKLADASGVNDVWALAYPLVGGTDIYRWNGDTWAKSHVGVQFRSFTVLSPDNAYATAGTRIWHWNGLAWSSTTTALVDELVSISATGPDDVFAVSGRDILHFDGNEWIPVRPPTDPQIGSTTIKHVAAYRDHIDLSYSGSAIGGTPFRRLIRTRLWNCKTAESVCNDGVDDDCDLVVDHRDPDCP